MPSRRNSSINPQGSEYFKMYGNERLRKRGERDFDTKATVFFEVMETFRKESDSEHESSEEETKDR